MKAERMFKELGYGLTIENKNYRYYRNGKSITFMTRMNNKKTIWGVPSILDVDTHKAIHRQMIELEWINQ